ncbi:hypothetical protein COCC4DRAFT_34789 [Bipolaris maydis ATCC 48331]|uniref:Uncharacterized protein n=2 Tax=Cochliobolus heterostrophus TaxID=5016 RepID=M2UCU4_COCH5|nr:uncharacterized protein COCC4DRAFT_34789 [Bipolaris maydis ATCC 48331]EMD85732.1 hypothetical protein COCHEDRAFT_1024344 [Bipolaris maydis C5]ENH99601.1 hypothetical protein COCC4DRAFT_34789 [Bipolaris maydis ATCC 48331]
MNLRPACRNKKTYIRLLIGATPEPTAQTTGQRHINQLPAAAATEERPPTAKWI